MHTALAPLLWIFDVCIVVVAVLVFLFSSHQSTSTLNQQLLHYHASRLKRLTRRLRHRWLFKLGTWLYCCLQQNQHCVSTDAEIVCRALIVRLTRSRPSVDCALVRVMQVWLLCAQRAGSWFFTTSCVRELLAALAVCLLDSPTLAYFVRPSTSSDGH